MVGASVLSVVFFVVLAAVSGGFTLLGGHLLRRWLDAPRLRSLWTLLISAASLGIVCLLMYAFGEPYFYALFLMIIWGTATVTALVFLWRARRMGRARMVASAVLAVGYPLLRRTRPLSGRRGPLPRALQRPLRGIPPTVVRCSAAADVCPAGHASSAR